MRIACLVSQLNRPSYRFRIEQMRPHFAERGHTLTPVVLPKSGWKRLRTFAQVAEYDIVLVQQHTFGLVNHAALEWYARKLVYDVDDAVFLRRSGQPGLRRVKRFERMIRSADLVTCGNRFLADAARGVTKRVVEIPTAINTERFHREDVRTSSDRVTIVWTGSRSTSGYLRELLPVFDALPSHCRLKILSDIVDPQVQSHPLRIEREIVTWSAENEVRELADGDIGIMPMPHNEWTQGKCGCKALQYMSLGIPAVCSPVGVNSQIIQHAQTGYLARGPSEWLDSLTQLAEDFELRTRIGQAGRQRVEAAYSLRVVGPMFVEAVESAVLNRRTKAA